MNWGIHLIAKSPEPGFCNTRLASELNPETAAKIQAYFLLDHLDLLEQKALNFHLWLVQNQFIFPLPKQIEKQTTRFPKCAFSQTMNRAFETGKQKFGWSQALFIGVDCFLPLLQHLSQALESIESHRSVLGPCEDGGVYLIGVGSNWHTPFQNITWGSNQVYQQLKAGAPKDTHITPIGQDIDHLSDLIRLQAQKHLLPKQSRTFNFLAQSSF